MDRLENLITVREASKISGYNPDYLTQLIRTKKLSGKRVGRNWFTTKDAVTKNLSRKRVVVSSEATPMHSVFIALIGGLIVALFYAFITFSSVFSEQPVSTAKAVPSTQLDTETDLNTFHQPEL